MFFQRSPDQTLDELANPALFLDINLECARGYAVTNDTLARPKMTLCALTGYEPKLAKENYQECIGQWALPVECIGEWALTVECIGELALTVECIDEWALTVECMGEWALTNNC